MSEQNIENQEKLTGNGKELKFLGEIENSKYAKSADLKIDSKSLLNENPYAKNLVGALRQLPENHSKIEGIKHGDNKVTIHFSGGTSFEIKDRAYRGLVWKDLSAGLHAALGEFSPRLFEIDEKDRGSNLNRLMDQIPKKKHVERATENFRKNVEAAFVQYKSVYAEALGNGQPNTEKNLAEMFQKRLKENYSGFAKESLSFVDPNFNSRQYLELTNPTFNKENNAYPAGLNHKYMVVDFAVENGIPGVKIGWANNAGESPAYLPSIEKFLPLTDEKTKVESGFGADFEGLTTRAKAEFEVLRPKLDREAFKKRTGVAGEGERDRLRENIESTWPGLALDAKMHEGLQNPKCKEMVDKWAPETKEGIAKIREDMCEMGFPVDESYYQLFFDQLERGKKEAKEFYESIKDAALARSRVQAGLVSGLKSAETKSKDIPVYQQVFDFGTNYLEKFWDSVQGPNKNMPRAAMYGLGLAAGIWVAIASVKYLRENFSKSKVAKAIVGGIAVFTAHEIARSMGYDVLKKVGLKDNYEEVKGTPLEALAAIEPEAKNLDGEIYLDSGFMNMGDFYDKYRQAQEIGGDFVDPAMFSVSGFKKFRHLTPADRSSNSEYDRTGKELFKIMNLFGKAYDKVVKRDPAQTEFYGREFHDAMQSDNLRGMRVVEFSQVMLTQYQKVKAEPWWKEDYKKSKELAGKGADKAKKAGRAAVDWGKDVIGA